MNSLPPFRYFLYVLATVNLVMAAVLLLVALAFTSGLNVVAIVFITLVVNFASAISVVRQFGGSR
jgi:hypothetical protein